MMEVLECLQVMEYMDSGFKWPATILLAIVEFIVVVITVMTMEEVYIGIKRAVTLHIEII